MKKIYKCGHRSTGYNEENFDKKWLDFGEIVEYEHTCNKKQARRIAMDHLSESPDYYKKLEKMEKLLEKQNKSLPDKRKTTLKKSK